MYWTFRVSWAVVFGSELISRFMPYISHMSRIKTHKTWENPQEIHLQMVDFPFCHVRFCFFLGGRRLYGIYDCHWWKEPWNSWWWNFHLRVPSEGSWKSTACGPSGGGNVRGFCERNQLNELWNYWSPQLPPENSWEIWRWMLNSWIHPTWNVYRHFSISKFKTQKLGFWKLSCSDIQQQCHCIEFRVVDGPEAMNKSTSK